MNDRDLDTLISAHGDAYNTPPSNPPLREIRNRVYQARRRRFIKHRVTGALAAAAVVVLVVGLMGKYGKETSPAARVERRVAQATAADPVSEVANQALSAALRSAQAAAANNPEDPYYAEHYRAMQANTAYFNQLQQRHAGGNT